MNDKKIILPTFICIILLQLFVPAKVIFDRENVIKTGTEYKFKTVPIDPNDPFRGKYIILNFENNNIVVDNGDEWIRGETIYVSFKNDEDGFAMINSVSKTKPKGNKNFLKTKVNYVRSINSNELTIYYPFDRYYMEESKAYNAELVYRESHRDTNQITYALVNIKNGQAVLKDVLINDIPIVELVKNKQDNVKN